MKGENKALSMIVEIFPTYIFLTEYSHTLDEEFKYIKNLKWREPKSSQINLQSIETRLLHCKELFKIKKFIHKSIIEYLDQDLWGGSSGYHMRFKYNFFHLFTIKTGSSTTPP